MAIRFRRTLRLGPLRLHLTERGYRSWSVKIGPWSWSSRTRAQRVDLPGPLYYQGGRATRRSVRRFSRRRSSRRWTSGGR